MAAPDSGIGDDALELFAAWLSRREKGEFVEFEQLLRAHPALRLELVDLEATWKRLCAASDSVQSLALQERIQGRHGKESPTEVSLRERTEGAPEADLSFALIAQLAAQGSRYGRSRFRGEVARGRKDTIRTLTSRLVLAAAAVELGTPARAEVDDGSERVEPVRGAVGCSAAAGGQISARRSRTQPQQARGR